MELKIKNRLVIINGPSCSGKSALADRIQEECSGKCVIIGHDDILEYVDKNQPQEKIDEEFRGLYLGTICNALSMPDIDLLVLDSLNIEIKRLLAFISLIRLVGEYRDPITLVKMNIDAKLHDEFIRKRTNDPYFIASAKSQVVLYKGIEGSLNKSIPYCDTTVVKDPRDVTITYDLPKKGRKK